MALRSQTLSSLAKLFEYLDGCFEVDKLKMLCVIVKARVVLLNFLRGVYTMITYISSSTSVQFLVDKTKQ